MSVLPVLSAIGAMLSSEFLSLFIEATPTVHLLRLASPLNRQPFRSLPSNGWMERVESSDWAAGNARTAAKMASASMRIMANSGSGESGGKPRGNAIPSTQRQQVPCLLAGELRLFCDLVVHEKIEEVGLQLSHGFVNLAGTHAPPKYNTVRTSRPCSFSEKVSGVSGMRSIGSRWSDWFSRCSRFG